MMPKPHRKFINISHQHKLIYYLIARAASTSIRYAIGCSGNPSNAHRRAIRRLPEPYRSFTVVRNPWDRLVSVWSYACEKSGNKPVVTGRLLKDMGLQKHCSFRRFALRACEIDDQNCNMHYRSQHLFTPRRIDRILRFEELGNEWQRLREEYPSLPELEWHEASNHEYFMTYYDRELLDMVRQRYQVDIDTFAWEIPT